METAGLVPVFMIFTDGINFLADGIGREILERLRKAGGTFLEDSVYIKAEVLKRLYEEMLIESDVQFTYYTKLVDVTVKNGVVREGICDGKSGLFAVRTKVFIDGTDEQSLTHAYIHGRKSMLEYKKYYMEYLKGYEKMELAATASLLGIRETRRIKREYVLNFNDFKNCSVFEDEIGRYSYRIDIHESNPSRKSHKEFLTTSLYMDKGKSYGIPYRILVPLRLKNVLVAGRCVSTDRCMQSSIRVMPGCYITGQAAGMAATIMVEDKKDSRSINVRKLQKRLKKAGAYLPNFR